MMFVETIEAGQWAYKNRSNLHKMWTQYKKWFRRGTMRIAVFGAGGVGKTTLGKVLSGQIDGDSLIGPYERSTGKDEDLSLTSDTPTNIIVVPGQLRYRNVFWDNVIDWMEKGNSKGIINVVSYGLHSLDTSYTDSDSYKNGMPLKSFRKQYAEEKRSDEITALKAITRRLIRVPGNLWMITLVSKQDLWWKQRKAVQKHYEVLNTTHQNINKRDTDAGPTYNDLINEIRDGRSEHSFSHELLSAAIVNKNLVDKDYRRIYLTAEGYDQTMRIANLSRLIRAVEESYTLF